MKKLVLFLVLVLVFPCYGGTTNVGSIDGAILHSIQSPWVIADEELSDGTEPDALAVGELTLNLVKVAIAADVGDDGEISIFPIPSKWNGIRFRSINITAGSGTVTYQIYFGTLGGESNCDLVHAGQLVFISGTQVSMYDQIEFTSGGTIVPKVGDIVTGNTNKETAVIVSITDPNSNWWNDWGNGTANGTVTYKSATGAFASDSETITLTRKGEILTADAYTHAASDLIDFEYADTLVVTAKAWVWKTAISNNDETIAEVECDVKGADTMVIVASVCDADAKLLCKGY